MSVSVKDGVYTATVANVDLSNAYPVEISFRGFRPKKAEASIVTGDKCAKNTFDDPNAVTEEKAEDATLTEHGCSFEIPACSVMMIQLR
jgi:alpha-L-arabinofuranosidase